jgi:DNA-binding CsgD family transcriptional regulator
MTDTDRVTLTPRQVEVLQLYADGHTSDQVAAALHLTRHGVKSHMARILERLNARTRMHAVHLAHHAGILT